MNISQLEYLCYLLSDWHETYFSKTRMTMNNISKKVFFYVTSGLANMTSSNFRLQISLLFFVGLSHNLVRVIWVVHVTMRSYIISCERQGHLDIWGQWQGQCKFFSLSFDLFVQNSAKFLTESLQIATVIIEKKKFRLTRYYVINTLK